MQLRVQKSPIHTLDLVEKGVNSIHDRKRREAINLIGSKLKF